MREWRKGGKTERSEEEQEKGGKGKEGRKEVGGSYHIDENHGLGLNKSSALDRFSPELEEMNT